MCLLYLPLINILSTLEWLPAHQWSMLDGFISVQAKTIKNRVLTTEYLLHIFK